MTKKNNRIISINVQNDFYHKLKCTSDEQKRTMSAILKEAFLNYYDEMNNNRPTTKVIRDV